MPLSVTRPFLTPSNESATVTTPGALSAMSRALEDVALQGLPDAQIIVGLKHISAFYADEQHYQDLAAACGQLWICAMHDEEPPVAADITFVPTRAEWPVADERFVVINAPGFASALLACEVAGDIGDTEGGFQTMFTSDARLVNAICRSLEIELDLHVAIPTQRDAEAQQLNLRRFNKLALEYQERQLPRHNLPIVTAPPQWAPSLTPGQHFGERAVG